MNYSEFLEQKKLKLPKCGIDVPKEEIHSLLFDFQRDIVHWALQKGRAAIFADTGLGKTLMQIEWARLLNKPTLIIAPLSVAQQTIKEAEKIGVSVEYSNTGSPREQITITNYEQIEKFNPDDFDAVVLDESSILKAVDSKTRRKLTEMFSNTAYRLCCTATPAPNDTAEIGNHAAFLGIMSYQEMLSAFFIHDSGATVARGWRLKGHGKESFYRWLASWSIAVRKPDDLGYENHGFDLPPLELKPVFVEVDHNPTDELFFTGLHGIQDRLRVRRETLEERTDYAADLVNDSDEQWLVWCGLNDESNRLSGLIDGAVEVQGADDVDTKIEHIEQFLSGQSRVLVSKPSICGFGMNFQHCHNMIFVGLSDSWEAYYQAIRRSYRFGQTHPVNVYIVLSDKEHEIYENIQRKDTESKEMIAHLIENVQEYEREELQGEGSHVDYKTDIYEDYDATLMLGDSTERIAEIDNDSIDLTVFSPPFLDLYTYTATERDLGNSLDKNQFFEHFKLIIQELLRVTKPGRNVCVHVQNVAAKKVVDGYIGMKDFRGDVIREFIDKGFIYHSEYTIDKNPQIAAIRSKAKGLLFATLKKDSTDLRAAFADYILIFKKPGENETPVLPMKNEEMTSDDWIQWAHPVWYDIRETDTLNAREAKDNEDEKHVVPLQLRLIERLIKLYSNPGELVLDPFMGIGSTGYEAIKYNRHFIGCELKESYYETAIKNIRQAKSRRAQVGLFDEAI